MVSQLQEARLIEIPCHRDGRGVLSVVDWEDTLPFIPKRFYYILNTGGGVTRGNHAHVKEAEVVLALNGSFTVLTDNGSARTEHVLDRPGTALYVPALIWHELYGFSEDAVCAVFASERFDLKDYCGNYEAFLDFRRQKSFGEKL